MNLILKLIVLNLLGNSINSPDFERRWSVGVLAMQIYVDIYTLISCPYLNPRDRVYIYIVHGYLNRDNEPVSTCTVVRHTGNQQDLIRVFQEILDNSLINITIGNEHPPFSHYSFYSKLPISM